MTRRVAIIGTGLIGGSVGLALRARGAHVWGYDHDPDRLTQALTMGAIDETARSVHEASSAAEVVVVAVPVSRVAAVAMEALAAGAGAVTDVGSVKLPVIAEIAARAPGAASRFVGGHPMAGSEQDGLDGADAELFAGSTWVLTPTESTDAGAFATVRDLVSELGAEVVAVAPEQHDALVAVVSHVPQLAASTLMDVAAQRGGEHAPLLRLAAGGFRDMTRVAAAHPGIWPDICVANRDAILAALDEYVAALNGVRDIVAHRDREGLLAVLDRARVARRNLPVGIRSDEPLVELRIPVPDRPGVLAEVTTLAGRIGVNISDLEIAHSMEGSAGVLMLVVNEAGADALENGLVELGYHPSRSTIT